MGLAILSTLLDSTKFVVWISNKLAFGNDDDDDADDADEDSLSNRARQRVLNPLTNRLIDVDGPTHRSLVKRGLLPPDPAYADYSDNYNSDAAAAAAAAAAGWSFREIAAGAGVAPSDGSVAVVRLTARIGGPDGPPVAETPPGGPPFAFEVGDPAVLRGLDAAVRRMREGGRAALLLPPPFGYTPARRLPAPLPARRAAAAAAAAAGDELYVDLALEAVLALPPTLLAAGAAGAALPPKALQAMLVRDPEGRYRLDTAGWAGPD
jgi:hypothetical protein